MAASQTFQAIPERPIFPAEEEKILKYWQEIDAFQECLRQSAGKPPYNFYDGPPFATGLPHYGHIIAGTIKDVVTRYAHMRGYHVERRFGWDCHGLPIESEIDKKLNIKGRADVLAMGIDKYNEECRSIVLRYTSEWKRIIERFGRWVDFDNDYKTMQLSYMESIWWVFKQLWEKDMVYRKSKVMAYSTALNTPLANFEVQLNYKEVSDPSIIVRFQTVQDADVYILAWTTTPWTLPSNTALCVHPELMYHKIKKADGKTWIVGKDRWPWVLSQLKSQNKKLDEKEFEILETVKGQDLVGTAYHPLFDYFKEKIIKGKAWHIVSDKYVTTDAGTCVVHQAPAFGEDDNRVCLKAGVIGARGEGLVCPVDDSGCFTSDVADFVGKHVKAADPGIKEKLKAEQKLVFSGTEVHNYPHCWRSDTPLIYKAVPSWFVKVEEIRDKLIANNNKTYWVPPFVKEKRFHNWLADARDWCVSRTRYWGTPLPVWVSDDYEEMVCIGSVEELEKYAGRKITDIHRHFIDDIEIPSKMGKGKLKRVPDVFDCWFESGSMPYAQKHYPFENKETFEASFPAHFIAEGLDQTRGWFYTLMVLSTHLFDKPAFQNLIVNGLVLASDGKKMSKRLKNYPDPTDVTNAHGADAVRLYMCNSQVVRAEPLKFREEGVQDTVKDVFLPFYHAYRFFVNETHRYESAVGQRFNFDLDRVRSSANTMDQWIVSAKNDLIKFVRDEMEAYRLYTVAPRVVAFLNSLTNWFVRLNRDRMKGDCGHEDSLTALCTTYDVLLNVTLLLAPLTPFITEMVYQNLARALSDGHPLKAKSVHFVMMPEAEKVANPEIVQAMCRMQAVVELGRTCRERNKVRSKVPLKSMTILNKDDQFLVQLQKLEMYLAAELNVEEIKYVKATEDTVLYSGEPNWRLLGKKLGKDMKKVAAAISALTQDALIGFLNGGTMEVEGYEITLEEMTVKCEHKGAGGKDNLGTDTDGDSIVVMDFTKDPELDLKALVRDVCSKVQQLRKDAKLQPDDPVDMWALAVPGKNSTGTLEAVLKRADLRESVNKSLRRTLWNAELKQGHEVQMREESYDLGEDKLTVFFTVRGAYFNTRAISELTNSEAVLDSLKQSVKDVEPQTIEGRETLDLSVEGKAFALKQGTHFAYGPAKATWIEPLPYVAPEPVAAAAAAPESDKKPAPKKGAKDATKKAAKSDEKVKAGDKQGKQVKGKTEADTPVEKPAVDVAEFRKKQLKKVIKEGGKRGVEIEGAADMGGLQFFCTSMDEPQGDMEFLVESMNAMNAQPAPGEEERKGCSGHIGKTIFSAGTEQLSVVAFVPEDKVPELNCEEWLTATLALFQGELLTVSPTLCTGRILTNSDKGVFPLKIREPMILEANNFLRKKGLFPEDKDSDDEMVFGDDDFPS